MTARVEDKHIDIESVKVNGRFRKDLGDLASLKASIEERGLLQAIAVTSDGTLIAGQRRLHVLRELGWRSVPVRVMADLSEAEELLAAERDENTCRLDMKTSEMVALGMALEEIERPAAKKRSDEGRARAAKRLGPAPVDEDSSSTGGRICVRDRVSAALGVSHPTYTKAKMVVDAAASGDEIAVAALEQMDRTGKVEPAFRKIGGKDRRPEKRVEGVDLTKGHNRQRADANKNRVAKVIYGLEGTAAGFDELQDLRWVLASASAEDLGQWDQILGQAARAITALRKRLKEAAATP